jgi:hypothetical protein
MILLEQPLLRPTLVGELMPKDGAIVSSLTVNLTPPHDHTRMIPRSTRVIGLYVTSPKFECLID